MSRYLLFAVIALGIGLSIWEIASRGAQTYERMLVARVSNGLEVLGFDWAEIRADGLKLEIHGHAPDTFARELALESVRATAPIATITSYATATLAPPEHRDPVRVELLRDQRGVTMTGQTASREMRQRLNDALKGRDAALAIQDLTGIQAAQPPRGWGAEITVASMAATALANAYVVMEPGRVLIDGQAASSDERAALTESLREVAGERVVLALRIRIPASVIAPFTFAAQKDAGLGLRLETCAVRSEEEQVVMGKILKLLGPSERLSLCRVGLGGPGGDWTGAIAAGVEALEALPAGRIEIEYRTARLSGLPPTSPALFESAAERFVAALPEGFEAETALHADDVATRTGIARDLYWLTASRSSDGVTISGQMPDRGSAQAVSAYAKAIFGTDRVVHDLRVVDRPAPPDWQIAAMGALDQLALSEGGDVSIAGYGITLRAKIAEPALAGEMHRELVNGLPDYEISTSFEVDLPEKLKAVAMPGPRCADLLNRANARRPVDFKTGSARITEESEQVLDDLVAVFARCTGDPIEIGGHTDSQGPEDLNQRLSQARAEAVLAGLTRRGVSHRQLTARGYGETVPIADNRTEEGRAANRRIEFLPAKRPEPAPDETTERDPGLAEADAAPAEEMLPPEKPDEN